ncbi:unnamed protein product [Heterobilharzia americana]|nr:unnamed protein product [Heterobilharzia americana]
MLVSLLCVIGMSFSQTYQQTDANYDIPRELETNQLTQTLQAGSEDTNGEKHLLNTNTSSSTSIADINSCSHNNNNSQIIKMNMNMDVQRNNALNPIFNFWRNSTRRSGNWGSRTGTKKSFVWKYFFHPELQTGTKDLAHTQCIICDSLLAFNNSGTTTTMLNHLKSRHSEIVQQEYHQSKKTRCGPLTLREVNKMNKLNYNLLSDEKKFINWSTSTPTITTASTASTIYKRNFPFLSPRRGQRGRPPGACRYSDHSMTGEKFSRNIDENVNSMNKFESSINNKDVSLSQFAAQIEARASNSSFEVMNEKSANSVDQFWTVPNEFSALNNSHLFNTLPPMINNELIFSTEALSTHLPTSSTSTPGLMNSSGHVSSMFTTSNSAKEIFSEIFTNYLTSLANNFSNMQLNLSELANLYLNELYKQVSNSQSSVPINESKPSNKYVDQCVLSEFNVPLELPSNDSLEQKVTTDENVLQDEESKKNTSCHYQINFRDESIPLTNFSMKSNYSLPVIPYTVDTNEPLDLSFNTMKQQFQIQERVLENFPLKSKNSRSPSTWDVNNNYNNVTDEDDVSAFARVYKDEEFCHKSPKQFSDGSLLMNETLAYQRNYANSIAANNDIKEDQVNPNQRYNESSSVTMDAEAVDKHLSTNEFQLTKPKIGESAVYSPHCLINAYSSSSCFYPSCNEFHHRLAYFLIRDFHPPSILKEEGFKILISTLWDKFRKTNVNVNYNLEFNLLPSSDFMENEILTRLYQEMKFRVDNKIRSLINLQKSSNFSINIPNITIFLKFWSLNQHDNIIFHANNPSFDYVDVELHFFTNYNNVYEKDNIFYGTFELTKTQIIYEILKPFCDLICSSYNSNIIHILSEWPLIILTNSSECILTNLEESFPLPSYLIVPCVDAHMNNASQSALCLPSVKQVLRNYYDLRQKFDESVQETKKPTSKLNINNQQNEETNQTMYLPNVLNLIKWTHSNLHLLPNFTESELKLANQIQKLIEIGQETERLCREKLSCFTVSMIRPMLENLYSMNTEKKTDDLADQFCATTINYLKTIYNENGILDEYLLISTFLDPRFKCSLNRSECDTAVNILQNKVGSLNSYIEKQGIKFEINYLEEFEQFIHEYINEKPVGLHENPLDWWSNQYERSEKYHIFKNLVSYYLTVPMNVLNNNRDGNCRNCSNRQSIDELVKQFEKSFKSESSGIHINSSNQGVKNETCQEKELDNMQFNSYYQPDHFTQLWSRIGRKFIPMYRFLRKNWDSFEKKGPWGENMRS